MSGRAEGLAACSAMEFFSLTEGTITDNLSRKVGDSIGISLPFEILTIYVEALPHDLKLSMPAAHDIKVRSVRKLGRFRTGQTMKVFEFTLTYDNFYSLSSPERRDRAAAAFLKMAELTRKEFRNDDGERLASLIIECAAEFRMAHE